MIEDETPLSCVDPSKTPILLTFVKVFGPPKIACMVTGGVLNIQFKFGNELNLRAFD
jgi:hypothetical protein